MKDFIILFFKNCGGNGGRDRDANSFPGEWGAEKRPGTSGNIAYFMIYFIAQNNTMKYRPPCTKKMMTIEFELTLHARNSHTSLPQWGQIFY